MQLAFRGTTLVNVRLYPYVMILTARPSLLDPERDGHYVLQRIWKGDQDYCETTHSTVSSTRFYRVRRVQP